MWPIKDFLNNSENIKTSIITIQQCFELNTDFPDGFVDITGDLNTVMAVSFYITQEDQILDIIKFLLQKSITTLILSDFTSHYIRLLDDILSSKKIETLLIRNSEIKNPDFKSIIHSLSKNNSIDFLFMDFKLPEVSETDILSICSNLNILSNIKNIIFKFYNSEIKISQTILASIIDIIDKLPNLYSLLINEHVFKNDDVTLSSLKSFSSESQVNIQSKLEQLYVKRKDQSNLWEIFQSPQQKWWTQLGSIPTNIKSEDPQKYWPMLAYEAVKKSSSLIKSNNTLTISFLRKKYLANRRLLIAILLGQNFFYTFGTSREAAQPLSTALYSSNFYRNNHVYDIIYQKFKDILDDSLVNFEIITTNKIVVIHEGVEYSTIALVKDINGIKYLRIEHTPSKSFNKVNMHQPAFNIDTNQNGNITWLKTVAQDSWQGFQLAIFWRGSASIEEMLAYARLDAALIPLQRIKRDDPALDLMAIIEPAPENFVRYFTEIFHAASQHVSPENAKLINANLINLIGKLICYLQEFCSMKKQSDIFFKKTFITELISEINLLSTKIEKNIDQQSYLYITELKQQFSKAHQKANSNFLSVFANAKIIQFLDSVINYLNAIDITKQNDFDINNTITEALPTPSLGK